MSQEKNFPQVRPVPVPAVPGQTPVARQPRNIQTEKNLSNEDAGTYVESEAKPETLRAYLNYLAESSRRFDAALHQYHLLLQQQEKAEGDLGVLEQQFKNEQRLALLKAKATKLAWATVRYVTSSSIVSTGAGAATYAVTGDPSLTVLAGTAGAMVGSAAEFSLSRLEQANDYSDKFFELYEPTRAYMQDKKRREQNKKDAPVKREAEISALTAQLLTLQDEITSLEHEIDELGTRGDPLYQAPKSKGLELPSQSQAEAEKAVQALVEHVRTAGERLNTLLAQYFEMTLVAESAEQYLTARQQAYDNRELMIQMKVTARKAWEMLKTAHITLGWAGIFGMNGYIFMASETAGSTPWGVAGGAVGAAIGWFQMSRLEKKVWNRNIPVGQYEIRDQLAVREDYQKAIDPELRQRESLLTEAQRLRQRTLAEHAQLSAELEAFMAKYPMQGK